VIGRNLADGVGGIHQLGELLKCLGRLQPDLAKLFNLAAIQTAGNPGY
jgi:hypothetical protein